MKKSKESNVICLYTCSMCFEEDPPEISGHGQGNRDTNSEVMWIECPHCSLWFHSLCVSEECSSDDFMCFLCIAKSNDH